MPTDPFDEVRRPLGPAAVDLADALATSRVGRRDFLRRGAMLGMSATAMTTIVQACSSDDDPVTTEPLESPVTDLVGTVVLDAESDPNRIVVGVRQGDANSGLDPVNMTEIGTYAVVAQSFEYLVGVSVDGAVEASGLALSWTPNDDGSTWTFELRTGPQWSDGTPVTSADVAATMDRLVAVDNPGLAGVLAEGAVATPNDRTAVFRLLEPNGNFPALLSPDNPQSVITPVEYRTGTTLDSESEGTGPWILDSFDAPLFVAVFRRNPSWWGGRVESDVVELRGFADESDAVLALEAGEIHAVQRFASPAGRALLEQPGFTTTIAASSAHRQLWFNTRNGPFSDRRLRLAVAWAIDRRLAVDDTNLDCGIVANDHPVHPSLGSMPFYDPSAADQRTLDIDRSMAFLADAGVGELLTVLHTNEAPEAVELAELVRNSVAPAGIAIAVESESDDTFYRETWCPVSESRPACAGAADFGIIENGHEALPDVVLDRAFKTNGTWNASNYANDEFDQLLREYRRSIDLDGQRMAIGGMQRILWDDVPAVIPCFDDLVAGHGSTISGVRTLPSGQVILTSARKR